MDKIKEEVYKCSKCGLCKSVCPIYLATKNETLFARGRYIILNNFFNNKKKLTKKFIKNLDICLNCNLCKNFCPSNIDAKEIFTNIKSIYKFKSGIFSFNFRYKLDLYLSLFKKKQVQVERFKYTLPPQKEKIVYFQGCTNKYINHSDKNATLNILQKLGYNVVKINGNCCGLPFLSDGNYKSFDKNAKKIIKSIPKDISYIVCSCDSCYETLMKIKQISSKLIRIDELLKSNNYEIKVENNTVYHNPLIRTQNAFLPSEIKKINRKGACSLMENYFLLKHPDIAEQILENTFYKKDEIDNKTIITTCQLDKIGLEKCIKKINSNANLYSLSEYICLSDKDFQEK